MLPPINTIRADVDVPPVASMDEFLRRAPLVLIASGKPFQYPQTDWGDAVQMIGPCVLDPVPDTAPDWLGSIERPIVLVTTSSEKAGRREPCPNRVSCVGRRAGARRRHFARRATRRNDDAAQRDGVPVRPPRRGAGSCSLRGDARRYGRDAEGTRPWHTGMRRAIRTRSIRGRPTRRGSPVRHPTTGQEAVTGATAYEGARSDDNDRRCEKGGGGFRGHRRRGPRRRPL